MRSKVGSMLSYDLPYLFQLLPFFHLCTLVCYIRETLNSLFRHIMVNNCRKYLTLFYMHMIFYCCHLLEAVCVSVYNILFLLIMVRRTTYVIFFRPMEILLMCICACCMHFVCPHGLDVSFVLSFFISLCGGGHGGSELTVLVQLQGNLNICVVEKIYSFHACNTNCSHFH